MGFFIKDKATFDLLIYAMLVLAVVVFFALYKINAGYGIFQSGKWGKAINNKLGWFIMEAPVFIFMLLLWLYSERKFEPVPFIIFLFFQFHYFQRSFIFPFMLKGTSRIPLTIVIMGILFNSANATLQGGWLFYFSPPDYYPLSYLKSPQFIVGTCLFFSGFLINIQSDKIIRSLRTNGDTKHYLPKDGFFRYVSSANYFGEILEWTGFAILTWSLAGLTFAVWTAANLVPRAASIHQRYQETFPDECATLNQKRVFPFIY